MYRELFPLHGISGLGLPLPPQLPPWPATGRCRRLLLSSSPLFPFSIVAGARNPAAAGFPTARTSAPLPASSGLPPWPSILPLLQLCARGIRTRVRVRNPPPPRRPRRPLARARVRRPLPPRSHKSRARGAVRSAGHGRACCGRARFRRGYPHSSCGCAGHLLYRRCSWCGCSCGALHATRPGLLPPTSVAPAPPPLAAGAPPFSSAPGAPHSSAVHDDLLLLHQLLLQ